MESIFASAGFSAREKDTLVLKLQHGSRVLAISGNGRQVFDVEGEADVVDDVSNDLVGRLDACLARNVGKVIQQGTEVDPFAACKKTTLFK